MPLNGTSNAGRLDSRRARRSAVWGVVIVALVASCGGGQSGTGAGNGEKDPPSDDSTPPPDDSTPPPDDSTPPPEDPTCYSCHGDEATGNCAPPPVSWRQGDAGDPHQAHLQSSPWRASIACETCHELPTDAAHPSCADDTLPAEIQWSGLALSGDAQPTFDHATRTCSDSYCHGSTLTEGGSTPPTWEPVPSDEASLCGGCHGMPPALPHVQRFACGVCHGGDPDDCTACHGTERICSDCHGTGYHDSAIAVEPAYHIDGRVDVEDALACNACHGNRDGDPSTPQARAPPTDTFGNTARTARGVGAHALHLGPSSWHAQLTCDECHRVPSRESHLGHRDVGGQDPADVTFSDSLLATSDGAEPTFDPATLSCNGVYCHGATLSGGTATEPVWTTVDGSIASCSNESCHGHPPAGDGVHTVSDTSCFGCHPDAINADNVTFSDPATHINGSTDVAGGCGSCHGNPPLPATEEYAGGGGAHGKHVLELGHACSTCHGHNGDVAAPGHRQGGSTVLRANVDIAFDLDLSFPAGTSIGNGQTPLFDGTGQTCTVGCHNPVPADVLELTQTTSWSDPQKSCVDCHEKSGTGPPANHDLDPLAEGPARVRASCSECHATSGHTSGQIAMKDPDPTDAFSYADTGTSGLCRTCHDGGPGTYFANQSPVDQSAFWLGPAGHSVAGYDCDHCHDYHGGVGGGELRAEREERACYGCHDGVVAGTDLASQFLRLSHMPVDDAEQGAWPVECVDCHDPHADNATQPHRADPDPTDDIEPTGLDEAFCLTCHDGEQAPDKRAFLTSTHVGAGSGGCMGQCHVADAGIDGVPASPRGPHGSDYPSLQVRFEEELCGACHTETAEMSSTTSTHHRVLDSEQVTPAPLECVTCHDPHLVQSAPWLPVIDPNTGLLLDAADVPNDSGVNPSAASTDTDNFCLACHDGSWPGAKNIAREVADANVVDESSWVIGTKNKHASHADDPNGSAEMACTYCHNVHGNTGTKRATDPECNNPDPCIERGALLYDWLWVKELPYTGKKSCGTQDPQGSCH